MSDDRQCDTKPPPARKRFRLRLWALVVAAVLVPMLLGLVAVRLRDGARRSLFHYNLLGIGFALHNYHNAWDCFPPAVTLGPDGKPWHSWRAVVLSDVLDGMYRFDEPWDGLNNRKLHGTPVDILLCRSDPTDDPTSTSYLAVVGPRTAWPGTESARFKDVTDKTSHTIMLVEVADSGVHWMEPRDLTVEEFLAAADGNPGFTSNHGELHVMFVDGSDRFLSRKLDRETLMALFTLAGGEEVSLEELGE
jgi:hypothetical protein